MSIKKLSFPKEERLSPSSSIQTVFRKGKKYYCDGAKIFVLSNGMERNRIVFTFPRGYGTAVERNYSRRLSREVYRLCKQQLVTGFDLTVLIFPGNDEFSKRQEQIKVLFKKAGLWANER